jgi:hypothetical protein
MDSDSEKAVIDLALGHYGARKQLLKAAEEFNEAARACCRLLSAMENQDQLSRRLGRKELAAELAAARDNLVEELADAGIMRDQVTLILDRIAGNSGVTTLVAEARRHKLMRLEARINSERKREEFPDAWSS